MLVEWLEPLWTSQTPPPPLAASWFLWTVWPLSGFLLVAFCSYNDKNKSIPVSPILMANGYIYKLHCKLTINTPAEQWYYTENLSPVQHMETRIHR
jgi:hypothetical protein